MRQRNAQYSLPSLSNTAGDDSGSERVTKYLKALAAQHRCLRELFRKIHRASPSALCISDATAPTFITLQGLQDFALSGEISLPITSVERLIELARTCIVQKQPPGPFEKAGFIRAALEDEKTRYVSTKDLMHKVNSDAMRVFKGDVSAEFLPGAKYMNRMRTDATMPSGAGKTSRVQAMIDSTIGVSRSSALGSLGKKFSNRNGPVRFIEDAARSDKSKQVAYEPEALAKAWAKMRGMFSQVDLFKFVLAADFLTRIWFI